METFLIVASLALAIVFAWKVTSRYQAHRPIAVLLSTLLGLATAQYVLDGAVLAPLRASLGLAPWTGWAWGAALLSHALRLAWPAAIAGTALALFTSRKPWLAALGWAVAVLAYATIHPLAPTGGQARFHAVTNLAGAVLAAVVAGAWFGSKRTESLSSAQLTFSAIVLVELLNVPAELRVGPLQAWATPQALWLMALGLVAVMYGYALSRRVATCEQRQVVAAKGLLRANLFAESAVQTAERAEGLAVEARDLAETRRA